VALTCTNHILPTRTYIHFTPHILNPQSHLNTYILPIYKCKPRQPPNIPYNTHVHLTMFLLTCGDIEPNPGPLKNILRHHPPNHKCRNTTYFLLHTIKLKLEYKHLAQTFSPHLNTTHPLHPPKTISHPNLTQFIHSHRTHPIPRILYTLIVTIHPSLQTCENTLGQVSD
jgi:hypothetical protein